MLESISAEPSLSLMIRLLDAAVEVRETTGCCRIVKETLEAIVRSGGDFVPEPFLRPADGRYARRLLHLDPAGRYSVLVMVWDRGQGTPLHDHNGMWCVECVYRGRIRVTSYRHLGGDGELEAFEASESIFAGPGEAGALIPPLEHHVLENPDETQAVTLHVYGGEMVECRAFVPEGEGFRSVTRPLAYTA